MMRDKKRRRASNEGKPARTKARLTLVRRPGNKKKKKASSKPPVYLVVEHGTDHPWHPTYSVIKVSAGAAPRRLRITERGMSFAAVRTPEGPRIVGLGHDSTTVYNPKASREECGPRLVYPKQHPVLIPHGGRLYALSRSPSIVMGQDFMPWFFAMDLDGMMVSNMWRPLPPPPIFPCRINPLEYRDWQGVTVAAYAVVGSHILISLQQDKGTCAFDVDAEEWEMVDDKNLPFVGQAVPVGRHRFVAYSKAKGGAAAVYHIQVFRPGTSGTGKTELSIVELPVTSKGIVPGQLLCSKGKDSFSSFDVRFVDPGPEDKLDKARIVHRTYSLVEGSAAGTNSVVIAKQQKQIFKLRDPMFRLAHPLPVVAALTMEEE